jgi:hypothetical protein
VRLECARGLRADVTSLSAQAPRGCQRRSQRYVSHHRWPPPNCRPAALASVSWRCPYGPRSKNRAFIRTIRRVG